LTRWVAPTLTFLKLYLLLKPQDKSVTFESLVNSIVAAARAEATERMKKEQKKNGDTEALRAIAEVTSAKHEHNKQTSASPFAGASRLAQTHGGACDGHPLIFEGRRQGREYIDHSG
jgi:hypothetical protein